MKIDLNSKRLDYLPIHPWFHDSDSFSIYKPKIIASLNDTIEFNGGKLNHLSSEFVASIIEHTFEYPKDNLDCLRFVLKVLQYENKKLHSWWFKKQNIIDSDTENSLIYKFWHQNQIWSFSHAMLNLTFWATEKYPALTLSKLWAKWPFAFAHAKELGKIYRNKETYYDTSANTKNHLTKVLKKEMTRC